jgi:hypothetical protein
VPKASTRRRPQRGAREITIAESVLDEGQETSLLDLLDHVLNKGVMATGDVTLGVAGVDLIYLRLSALLCAADRVLPPDPDKPRRSTRKRSRR